MMEKSLSWYSARGVGILVLGLALFSAADRIGGGEAAANAQPLQIPLITADLDAEDPAKRIAAAQNLGRLGVHAKRAIPALIETLEDPDVETRATAAWALEQIASRGDLVVPALARAMDDAEPRVRAAAAYAMGVFFLDTELVVPVLARRFDDPDESVRGAIASSLSRMGAPAVPTLTEAIEHGDMSQRLLSTRALGAMGNGAKAAVPLLAGLLQDPQPALREAAASALGHIGRDRDWPAGLGYDHELTTMIPARRPLTGTARASYAPLLHGLMLERVVPPLIDALADQEAKVRAAAASALGRMRHEAAEATRALIDAIEDADSEVRRAVVNALGHVAADDPAALPPVAARLNDEDDQVRWSAARVLANYGAPAVPWLVEAMETETVAVRRLVVETLGDLGPAAVTARPALEAALGDPDAEVRDAAEWALGRLNAG